VNNGDAMLPALIAGLGLGVLPDFLIRDALADGRLEIVMPEWTPRGGSVHWLTPRRAQAQAFGASQRFLSSKVVAENSSTEARPGQGRRATRELLGLPADYHMDSSEFPTRL
jgi:LysR substrate binding domain